MLSSCVCSEAISALYLLGCRFKLLTDYAPPPSSGCLHRNGRNAMSMGACNARIRFPYRLPQRIPKFQCRCFVSHLMCSSYGFASPLDFRSLLGSTRRQHSVHARSFMLAYSQTLLHKDRTGIATHYAGTDSCGIRSRLLMVYFTHLLP